MFLDKPEETIEIRYLDVEPLVRAQQAMQKEVVLETTLGKQEYKQHLLKQSTILRVGNVYLVLDIKTSLELRKYWRKVTASLTDAKHQKQR